MSLSEMFEDELSELKRGHRGKAVMLLYILLSLGALYFMEDFGYYLMERIYCPRDITAECRVPPMAQEMIQLLAIFLSYLGFTGVYFLVLHRRKEHEILYYAPVIIVTVVYAGIAVMLLNEIAGGAVTFGRGIA
jgi:hypothetical protein